jgi:hypothetical protein
MDTVNAALDFVLNAIFRAFRWSPGLGLALISAAAGVAMLWVFQKTSNQTAIRAVKRRVQAHLLELRIYRDEPGVMWQAQKSLLASNLRYMGLMLWPALIMGLPFAILLVHLEAFYGRAPLPVGAETIITMGVRGPAAGAVPVLDAPAEVAVETPAVRVLDQGQVSWGIRPRAAVSGVLRIRVDGGTVEKQIESGRPGNPEPRFVAGRKVSSLWDSVWHPDEPRIAATGVDWVEIRYPDARVEWLGIRMHWLIWFIVVSMLAALLLKKRFRVVL